MAKIPKKSMLPLLLSAMTALLLITALYLYVKGKQDALNLVLGLFGVFAMLAVASWTFMVMEWSTRKTIDTILQSSQKQIEELEGFVGELRGTNVTLDKIAGSLEVVSEDIIARRELLPNLYVTFAKKQEEIDLRAGDVCDVVLNLWNGGISNATNPAWSIFIPLDIDVIDAPDFKLRRQGPSSSYKDYLMLKKEQQTVSPRTHISLEIKIQTLRKNIGIADVPFLCSCDGIPQNSGKLLINFVG